MAITLKFSQGLYQPIIDGVEDDNDNPVFQYIVVTQAIKHCTTVLRTQCDHQGATQASLRHTQFGDDEHQGVM
eukprot:474359-Rhodomonas_salina.2